MLLVERIIAAAAVFVAAHFAMGFINGGRGRGLARRGALLGFLGAEVAGLLVGVHPLASLGFELAHTRGREPYTDHRRGPNVCSSSHNPH